jgi:single-strand DNA-binding protein
MRKIEIIGNICKAPETRETASGKTVTYFTVAVNVKEDKSDFYQVNAWGKLGEICAKHLDKGRKVYVRGNLDVSLYSAHERTNYQLTVTADEVEFLSPAEKAETKPQKKSKENSDGYDQTPDDWATINSNDLPF